MAVGLRHLLADPESLVGLKLGCEGIQHLLGRPFSHLGPGAEISSPVEEMATSCRNSHT
jgi:hypothetical protein